MNGAHLPDPRREAIRRHVAARTVVRAWRELGGSGTATLVACSGGADSTGLLLALWASGAPITIGHVVHDMRSSVEAMQDRDAVEETARVLGVPFVWRQIEAREIGGNLESGSRRLRYEALAAMAAERGCGMVVTAHHARDQAETVLMRLMRGAGPRGLAGIHTRRLISREPRVVLARPALGVEPEALRALCTIGGVRILEDPTNDDLSRTRAAIRHRLLPVIREIAPSAIERMADAAEIGGMGADLIDSAARELLAEGGWQGEVMELQRAVARNRPMIVVCAAVRLAVLRRGGSADRLFWRSLKEVGKAVCDSKNHRREFRLGSSVCIVDAGRILIRPHLEPRP